MSFLDTYEPKNLNEFVFSDDKTFNTIQAYADGLTKQNLLLHGPYGTGKSTLGSLLPYAMTTDLQKPDLTTISGIDYKTHAKIGKQLNELVSVSGFNSDGRRYVVIDEVDRLYDEAQDFLAELLLRKKMSSFFILTTNRLTDVDGAIRSRCRNLRINPACENSWLPHAKRILSNEGYNFPDNDLLRLLKSVIGDNRVVLEALEDVCIARRQKVSSKIINLAS